LEHSKIADWDDAWWLEALAKYNVYERCHRDFSRRDDPVGRPWAIPAGASADHGSGVVDRCLAVLYPASVRGHLPVQWRGLEFFTKPRCVAVPTTTCRVSCAGSQRTSAFTTSITYAVGLPAIGCQICGIIRNSLPSESTQKAAEESAASPVTQFQMAQTVRGREFALPFRRQPRGYVRDAELFKDHAGAGLL